jgi:ribonuclease BN (tRNA processing enzyme)
VLFDCGAGTVHGFDRYAVDWRTLTHVAVSHFHTDHVGDLAALLWALKHGIREGARTAPLTILGPPGLARHLDALARAHGPFIRDPGFPVVVVEMAREDRWRDRTLDLELACHPTPHTEASVAWRLDAGGLRLGYTGDTGPSDEVGEFLRGAGLLIAECAVADPPELDTHLSPSTVARLLQRARPELALLTHLYPPLEPPAVPDLVRAAGYEGRVAVARDGDTVRVDARGASDPVSNASSPDFEVPSP